MSDLISREYMKSLGGACIAQRLKDGDLCPIISIDLLPSVEPERHICRECKWAKFYGNVDKNGNVECMWFCENWDGVTDEEGFCHEWGNK